MWVQKLAGIGVLRSVAKMSTDVYSTRMWADAQHDGPQPNRGGALCESSVIPFHVPRRKVWLTPTAGVLCSNAANIG